MPLCPILRLILAGLLAGSALLAPWPGEDSHTPPLSVGYELPSHAPGFSLGYRLAHADGPGDWPMFHHDPAHTGYNADETQLKPPLRLKWNYATGGRVWSSPAVADGVVYVGSEDGKVYALDAGTGAVRWSYLTGGKVWSSPAVLNGVVYVGSHDGKAYALDASTGAFRWSYSTGGLVASSPAVANGVVYVVSDDGKVYALDVNVGTPLWSYTVGDVGEPTRSFVRSSPAVANGVIYVAGPERGPLWALNASTGAVLWSNGDTGFSSPAVANGVVYAGFRGGYIYALNANTGVILWSYWLPANTPSSPAVANGVVYVGFYPTNFYALAAGTGAVLWSYGPGVERSSPAVANGVVYVGTGTGIYALAAGTGAVLWSYGLGAVYSSPAVAGGVVYVGSSGNNVYAFEAQPPPVSMLPLSIYQTSGSSFPISWTVPITWTGTAAASYDVQYRDGPSGAWTDLITSTTALSTAFSGQEGHTYHFRARSRTAAGALGDWSDPVSTTVDLTAPTGSISLAGGAIYATNPVTLTLPATDATSGLSQMALSNDGSAWDNWQDYAASRSRTLPGPDGPKAVYAKYKDAAGNASPVYSDTIILDTTAPTGTVTINGGASDTNSTTVTLALAAGDALSGLSQMSFSNDGLSYSPWEDYASTKSWSIPGGNGTKTVYARFRDNAGNVSQPYTDTIILNTVLPSSAVSPLALYQSTAAFPVAWSGTALGSGVVAGYDMQYKDGSSGQWSDWITSTLSTSAVFTGTEGHTYYFQSRARDMAGNVEPYVGGDGHTRTTVDLTPPTATLTINGGALDTTTTGVTLVVSATDTLSGVSQASYSDDGSTWSGWESYAATRSWSIPTGDGAKAVWARFRDAAGNLSSPVSDTIHLDTSLAPAYGLSVNEGAIFTSQVTVTLSLPANPSTAQMMLSNDGGFFGATWEPYAAYRAWAITQYGSYVIPRTVYVKYKDVNGNVYGPMSDEIILDLNAPLGSVAIEGTGGAGVQGTGARVQAPMPLTEVGGAEQTPGGDSRSFPASALELESSGYPQERATTTVTLRLTASDDVSGVGGMMVSNSPAFSGGVWETFSASKSWSMESVGKVHVTFRDNAGNASPIYATSISGAKESLPPVALGTVHPKTGGAIASSETGISVAFPAGAVAAKAEVTLAPAVESSQAANTGALKGIGKFLTLTAKTGETPVSTVSKAYTITVGYTAGDVAGIDESTLGMFWWNGSSWQKELGSRVDTAARTVSAAINHLSSFAVLGESSTRRVYLPLLVRGSSGW